MYRNVANPMDIVFGASLDEKINLVNSMNSFGFKLLKVFAIRHPTDSRNMCFAPLELFNSFIILLLGARGTTETQLEAMLGVHKFNEQAKYKELTELVRWIIKSNHDIMVYGTIMYVDQTINILPDFQAKVKKLFNLKPKRINFANLANAIKEINKDAEKMTDGIIENVININDLKEIKNVKLLISNAVFFRGYWLFKFGNIQKNSFTYDNGNNVAQIDMMSHTGYHRYYFDEYLMAEAVSIAYASSDIRMIVLLPKEKNSNAIYLADLLNEDHLKNLFFKLQRSEKSLTKLTIPRFALDAQKISLQKSVIHMGTTSIYEPEKANFSGITNDPIHLSKLVHKAFILVDERGTQIFSEKTLNENQQFVRQLRQIEPVQPGPRETKQQCIEFTANHPFMFIILDKITGIICLMGILADPTQTLEVIPEDHLTNEQISKLLAESDAQGPPEYANPMSKLS